MRVAALALTMILVLTGCDAAQQAVDGVNKANDQVSQAVDGANKTLDKVGVCAEALRISAFTPNVSNPQQAVDEAHKKAEELGKLATQAPDAAVQGAIQDVSKTLSEVSVSDFSPSSASAWLQEKTNQVNALSRACL